MQNNAITVTYIVQPVYFGSRDVSLHWWFIEHSIWSIIEYLLSVQMYYIKKRACIFYFWSGKLFKGMFAAVRIEIKGNYWINILI